MLEPGNPACSLLGQARSAIEMTSKQEVGKENNLLPAQVGRRRGEIAGVEAPGIVACRFYSGV